jgi:hypothetical protein
MSLRKKAFFCLEKNVGLKNLDFTGIENYFSKKRQKKTPREIS